MRLTISRPVIGLVALGLAFGSRSWAQPTGDRFREDFESYPAGEPSDLRDFDPLGPWHEVSEPYGDWVRVVNLHDEHGQALRWKTHSFPAPGGMFSVDPGGTSADVLTVSYLTHALGGGGIEMRLATLAPDQVHVTVWVRHDVVKVGGSEWFHSAQPTPWYRITVQANYVTRLAEVAISNTYSTGLHAWRLYDSAAGWADGELQGSQLNPNTDQSLTWGIADNGCDGLGHWIDVAPLPGPSLTDVAGLGDEYALLRTQSMPWEPNEPFDWTVASEVELRFHAYQSSNTIADLDDITVDTASAWHTGLYTSDANVVPNPGFELLESNRPVAWSVFGGQWAYKPDNQVAHSGQYSIKAIGVLFTDKDAREEEPGHIETGPRVCIDYTRPYRLTGWIKTELGAPATYLRLDWHKFVMDPNHVMGRWVALGSSESTHLTGVHDWTSVSLVAQPPYGTTHAAIVCCRTSQPGADGTAWFDDLYLDGLGEGIDLLYSQGGYHCSGIKQALVSDPAGTVQPLERTNPVFEVVQVPGGVVYTGELRSLGAWKWGREYWLADFTEYNPCPLTPKDGWSNSYQLRVLWDQVVIQSGTFDIRGELYADLARRTLDYFYVERCGMRVTDPNGQEIHDVCHETDACYVDANLNCTTFKDLVGGWHDAGNYPKYADLYGVAPSAMIELWQRLQPDWHDHPGATLADPLDEAFWGGNFLLKLQRPDGSFDRDVSWGFALVPPEDDPPGGRVRPIRDTAECWMHWQDVYALARLSWQAHQLGLGDPYLSAALLAYEQAQSNGSDCADMPQTTPEWILAIEARMLAADTYLYLRIDDDPQLRQTLRDHAEVRVDHIITALDAHNAFDQIVQFQYVYLYRNWLPFEFLIALMDWADACPHTSPAASIRQAIHRMMDDHVVPLCRYSPFGHMMEFVDGVPRDSLPQWGGFSSSAYYTTYHQGVAVLAARAALFLDRVDYLPIAEHHLQWVLGRNPRGVSFIGEAGYGVLGHKLAATFNFYAAIDRYSNGIVPGGFAHGLRSGRGRLGSAIEWDGYWAAHPRDFPETYIAADYPVPSTLGCTEVWSKHGAQFLYACALTEKALTTLAGQGDCDHDFDVDARDFLCFCDCMSGPDTLPAVAACAAFDFRPDADVDLVDLATFQGRFSGSQ